MTTSDCKNCQDILPDLLLDQQSVPSAVLDHMATCDTCQQDWTDLQATLSLMDEWKAPEPSAFFDTRLHARLREEQNAVSESLIQRLTAWFGMGDRWGVRPAMAGALALILLLGGGTAATWLTHHATAPASVSPTVDDLKIYDNNAQAVDQMDLLDDPATPDGAPQS